MMREEERKMDNNIKVLSFSSPKGGVGRTMTLANCANIYANGAQWAGIEKSTAILVDLDFHAPGIHYYNFESKISSQKSFAEIADNANWEKMISDNLSRSNIGLVFLLTKIIEEPAYKRRCALVAEGIRKGSRKSLIDFQEFVIGMLEKDEFNPTKHIIHYPSTNIYILPAGSPNNPEYNATVFKFEWLKFINVYMGLYLLDCILYKAVQHNRSVMNSKKPIRILLDQQAGSSVAAAINRSLADAHILVGGFNKQNQSGLKSLVEDFRQTYIIPENRYPWIVLNQYDGRKIALDYAIGGIKESPQYKFSEYDEENRRKYMREISQYKLKDSREAIFDEKLFERIYVTEFDKDAIQKEHFYETDKLSHYELTKLLVSIESRFDPQRNMSPIKKYEEKIVFIGEKVKINGGSKYSGPLNGIYELLNSRFAGNVIALAAKHEDIYKLSKEKKVIVFVSSNVRSIFDLSSGIYEISTEKNDITNGGTELELSLYDLDFISYPYHCITHLKNDILSSDATQFFGEYGSKAEDTLNNISLTYCEENIIRWKEYCIDSSQQLQRVLGVPLFINFQLLAYRSDYFVGIDDFHLKYRQEKHRDFMGFHAPGDLLDFVEVTTAKDTHNKYLDVYLGGNPENIAKWYEWQAIFSIFYSSRNNLRENKSLEEYNSFLKSPLSADALKNYFSLFSKSKKTESNAYTWDKLLEKFFGHDNEASLIFIWPDAIPNDDMVKYRTSPNFIYQAPPSFHIFEECWMFSIIKKDKQSYSYENKIRFLNYFLTPLAQTIYTKIGGLPTHKAVLSSLELWRDYAFLAPLWSIYFNKDKHKLLIKRESFDGIYEAGLKMGRLINLMGRLAERQGQANAVLFSPDIIVEKIIEKINKEFKLLIQELNGRQYKNAR